MRVAGLVGVVHGHRCVRRGEYEPSALAGRGGVAPEIEDGGPTSFWSQIARRPDCSVTYNDSRAGTGNHAVVPPSAMRRGFTGAEPAAASAGLRSQ